MNTHHGALIWSCDSWKWMTTLCWPSHQPSIPTTHFTINFVLGNTHTQLFTLTTFLLLHWVKGIQLSAPRMPWQRVVLHATSWQFVCNHSFPRQWPSHWMQLHPLMHLGYSGDNEWSLCTSPDRDSWWHTTNMEHLLMTQTTLWNKKWNACVYVCDD